MCHLICLMTSQRTLPLAPRGSLICHTVVVLRDSDTCRMYARLARVPVVNILSSRRRAVTSLALLGCPGSVPPAADLTSLNEDGTRLVIGGREVHVPTGYFIFFRGGLEPYTPPIFAIYLYIASTIVFNGSISLFLKSNSKKMKTRTHIRETD